MKYIKKLITPSNIIFVLILSFVLYQKVPLWISQHKKEGELFLPQNYSAFSLDKTISMVSFPQENNNTLAIFWATWCGPCKVEMKRLKKSVDEGKIPKNSIFAINSHESIKIQKKHVLENNYPFIFIQAPNLEKILDVQVTPTTAMFKKTKLHDLSSGISLIGIKQAESFLSSNNTNPE